MTTVADKYPGLCDADVDLYPGLCDADVDL